MRSLLLLLAAVAMGAQNLYPLPARVTKAPLGAGGAISIDAALAVSAARTLTAPFGAAVLARYQLLLRNKASAHSAQNQSLRLTRVVVDVASGADDTLGPGTNESYTLSFALVPASSATAAAAAAAAAAATTAAAPPSYWWRFPGSDCSSDCDLPAPASAPSDVDCPKAVYLANGSTWGAWCVARFEEACAGLPGCGGFNTDRIFKDARCYGSVGPLRPSEGNVDLYTRGDTPLPPPPAPPTPAPPPQTVTATVAAASIYGARHGLETLAQLVQAPAGIIAEAVAIADAPAYPYRGLMIDTGRHFLPLSLVRHAIDGLAATKMNVLHWHLLDSQSFPVASEAYPQLSAAGAFAAAATYTLDDLRGVVAYARQRGVRVVPEIEMPGHGSFSAGMPELSVSSCKDVLDPTRNSTYAFLRAFLAEMASVFDDELLYLGGDEVGLESCTFAGKKYQYCGHHCFDTDPAVAAWMAAQQPPLNSSELVQHFWQQLSERVLPPLNRTAGVWMSDSPNHIPEFLRPDMAKLPAGAVANVYQDWQAAAPLLDAGTPVVLSIAYDGWYLDHHPDFAKVYDVRPCDPALLDCDAHPRRRALLRGGSASMWGEKVDATNFDVNVWPGTTALAERLWSDPPANSSTVTAAAAQARHRALACHWKMWGIPVITRERGGSENVAILDATLPPCPADWCAVPP